MDCTPCSTCPPTKTCSKMTSRKISSKWRISWDLIWIYDVYYGEIIFTYMVSLFQEAMFDDLKVINTICLRYVVQTQATNKHSRLFHVFHVSGKKLHVLFTWKYVYNKHAMQQVIQRGQHEHITQTYTKRIIANFQLLIASGNGNGHCSPENWRMMTC